MLLKEIFPDYATFKTKFYNRFKSENIIGNPTDPLYNPNPAWTIDNEFYTYEQLYTSFYNCYAEYQIRQSSEEAFIRQLLLTFKDATITLYRDLAITTEPVLKSILTNPEKFGTTHETQQNTENLSGTTASTVPTSKLTTTSPLTSDIVGNPVSSASVSATRNKANAKSLSSDIPAYIHSTLYLELSRGIKKWLTNFVYLFVYVANSNSYDRSTIDQIEAVQKLIKDLDDKLKIIVSNYLNENPDKFKGQAGDNPSEKAIYDSLTNWLQNNYDWQSAIEPLIHSKVKLSVEPKSIIQSMLSDSLNAQIVYQTEFNRQKEVVNNNLKTKADDLTTYVDGEVGKLNGLINVNKTAITTTDTKANKATTSLQEINVRVSKLENAPSGGSGVSDDTELNRLKTEVKEVDDYITYRLKTFAVDKENNTVVDKSQDKIVYKNLPLKSQEWTKTAMLPFTILSDNYAQLPYLTPLDGVIRLRLEKIDKTVVGHWQQYFKGFIKSTISSQKNSDKYRRPVISPVGERKDYFTGIIGGGDNEGQPNFPLFFRLIMTLKEVANDSEEMPIQIDYDIIGQRDSFLEKYHNMVVVVSIEFFRQEKGAIEYTINGDKLLW